jgi:dsDNA-specific endonuclease/ATPase MutS2
LFAATTHYPEIKDFAARTPGLANARMAFDRENLAPLYRLEIGEAGESCALYIAGRLGMPERLLERARAMSCAKGACAPAARGTGIMAVTPLETPEEQPEPETVPRGARFNTGDSVMVYPQKDIGRVYAPADDKGRIGVQVRGKKLLVNHKRLKLKVPASELYPKDYDFSIVFDSVANRKARHIMERKHVDGNMALIKEGEDQ